MNWDMEKTDGVRWRNRVFLCVGCSVGYSVGYSLFLFLANKFCDFMTEKESSLPVLRQVGT